LIDEAVTHVTYYVIHRLFNAKSSYYSASLTLKLRKSLAMMTGFNRLMIY